MNITEFLEARIAEDEVVARAASRPAMFGDGLARWRAEPDGSYTPNTQEIVWNGTGQAVARTLDMQGSHIARFDPARVLAECAAKRAIVGLHHLERQTYQSRSEAFGYGCDICAEDDGLIHGDGPCETLMALAAVYDQHPDYDPAWRIT